MRRTSEPWSKAQLDAAASNRKPHRRQERVQPWQSEMVVLLHISGVVSRVPCSSRFALACGTDRNTNLTSTHQRQRTDSQRQTTESDEGEEQHGHGESRIPAENSWFSPSARRRLGIASAPRCLVLWCRTWQRWPWRSATPISVEHAFQRRRDQRIIGLADGGVAGFQRLSAAIQLAQFDLRPH
jgi:hypothetical protein